MATNRHLSSTLAGRRFKANTRCSDMNLCELADSAMNELQANSMVQIDKGERMVEEMDTSGMLRINAKLNRDRRLTIPPQVREVLGLKPGDTVSFVVQGDSISVVKFSKTITDPSQSIREANQLLDSVD